MHETTLSEASVGTHDAAHVERPGPSSQPAQCGRHGQRVLHLLHYLFNAFFVVSTPGTFGMPQWNLHQLWDASPTCPAKSTAC
eukprot:3361285-Amphidinium_carterae.1